MIKAGFLKFQKDIKVCVAMSGGVDSSVAAALLKQRGYDVFGVFCKFWSEAESGGRENQCCSLEAVEDARRVAQKLGIKFYVLNFKDLFKDKVVDDFVLQYGRGVTPNPCVRCNQYIKFDALWKMAEKMGADFLATGHYARVITRTQEQKNKRTKIACQLLQARDTHKDQSYFLYRIKQNVLPHLLFPIGGYTKPEVRVMAKKFGLRVHNKPESQEVCFVSTNLHEFLKPRINTKEGDIVEIKTGKVLGKHYGLQFYTIGQRKGLNVGGTGPYYAVDKNKKKNQLLVAGENEKSALFAKQAIVKNVSWISKNNLILPLSCLVKIRYQHIPAAAVITRNINGTKAEHKRKKQSNASSKSVKVIFDKPQMAITPGQSAVFYKGEEVLGGGIIQ